MLTDLIKKNDYVEFSSNYNPTTSSLLDQLFPNEKTSNLKVATARVKKGNAPIMALVHSFDTEANIAERKPFEQIEVTKLLVKEKIQLNEEYAILADELKDNSSVKEYIFNDMGEMSDRVATRIKVMKAEALYDGKITIKENNVNTTIDFGLASDHKFAWTWSTNASILANIKTLVDTATAKGYKLTRVVTSSKNIATMQNDANIRGAIFGANSAMIPTLAQLNNFMYQQYGLVFVAFDDIYRYRKADGTVASKRYIPDSKMIFFGGALTDTVGKCFYGITPTERNARLNATQSKNIYIMNNVWDTEDPVATWTKAEAVAIPVIADIDNIFVATIS